MGSNEMQRGYDDTGHLKQMAAGLVVRTFGSVDEAAKAVLGEDGGSNVDRLRRKFREQRWYEKGLAEYMDAEIASRGLIPEPRYHRMLRGVSEAVATPVETMRRISSSVIDKVRPRPAGSMVAVSLATTVLFAAAASGIIAMEHAMLAAVASSIATLVLWADRTSERVTARTASIHLVGLGLLSALLVAGFGLFDPSAAFTLGSEQGALAAAGGLTVMGVYATGFIGTQTRRSGTRKSLEVSCLIAALAIFSQIGTAIVVLDIGLPA